MNVMMETTWMVMVVMPTAGRRSVGHVLVVMLEL